MNAMFRCRKDNLLYAVTVNTAADSFKLKRCSIVLV